MMATIIKIIALSIVLTITVCSLENAVAQSWSILGNTGTNASSNFIGTKDNVALKFRTNNATRMTINSAGKTGIGTTSPQDKLHVNGTGNLARFGTGTTATTYNYWYTGNDVGSFIEQQGNTTTTGSDKFRIESSKSGLHDDYSRFIIDPFNGFAFTSFGTGSTNVGIGDFSPGYKFYAIGAPGFAIPVAFIENTGGNSGSDGLYIKAGSNTSTGAELINFLRPDGTAIGSIVQNTITSVNYFTPSDKRLKNITGASQKGLPDLMKINIYDYTFKSDPEKKVQTGFMAQELYEIFPQSVSKPRATNEPAEKNPWMVDYGSVTPLIIRSVQEQQKIIEDLSAGLLAEIKQNENLSVGLLAEQSISSNLQNENRAMKSRLDKLEIALSQCCMNYEPSKNSPQPAAGSQQSNDAAKLEQNVPNPFTQQTEIKFHLPPTFNSALIVISDESGKQVRTYHVQSSKPILLKGGELPAGMYSYSLIIDGTTTDARQMMLTK